MTERPMKAIYISLLIVILSFTGLLAQDVPKENSEGNAINSKSLFFAYGKAYNLKLDRTYSRLAKNGFNHLYSLGYSSLNNKRIITIEGNFIIGTLQTKGNSINTIYDYVGNVKFEYLKRVNKINNSRLSVYVGGNTNLRGDIWFPQDSDLRYGWDINFGTGMATSVLYRINPKLLFQYNLNISLLGILWRSHNNGQQLTTEEIQLENGILAAAFETPRFSHLFNTLYLDNSLKLFYNLSTKIDLYYNFGLSYKHIKEPLVKKGYEFNNSLGIAYKF